MKNEIQNKKIGVGILIFGIALLIIAYYTKFQEYRYDDGYVSPLMHDYQVKLFWLYFSYRNIFIFSIVTISIAIYLIIYKEDSEIKDSITNFKERVKIYILNISKNQVPKFIQLVKNNYVGWLWVLLSFLIITIVLSVVVTIVAFIIWYLSFDKSKYGSTSLLESFFISYSGNFLKVLGFTILLAIIKMIFSKGKKEGVNLEKENSKNYEKPVIKNTLRILFILFSLTVLISYLKITFFQGGNEISYNGVSFEIPEGWSGKEKLVGEGDVFQVSMKNLNSNFYEGQVVTFANQNLYFSSLSDFDDLKAVYLGEYTFENIEFYSIKNEMYREIPAKVLSYSFNYKGDESKIYGKIYQFNYKNRFFRIDQKMDKINDIDFLTIESSFKVKD